MNMTHASTLSDTALVAELGRLAGRERAATVALIACLAEFDARRLYAGEGYSSTFRYCTEVLHLSEDAAFYRIGAARAARKFPVVLDMLLSGELSPTTARLLAPRLTPENHRELLAAPAGKSREQVEEMLARWFPQPDVPSSVRALPTPSLPIAASEIPARTTELAAASDLATATDPPSSGEAASAPMASAPATTPRPLVRALAPDRYEIRFTASAETRDYLRRAQDLLGHAIPNGDLEQVFNRALRQLVEDLERKTYAATDRPQPSRGQSDDSRNIPASVKRAVRERDGNRCTWVAPSGHRCNERRRLQFHHDDPFGAGGKPTADRVRLLCRTHNLHESKLFYGPGREYGGVSTGGELAIANSTYAITRPGTGGTIDGLVGSAVHANRPG
jgi:hypothetical protein